MHIVIEQTASFDVDAQNCFTPLCPDELPVPQGETITAELNRQARFARLRVGSKDAHPSTADWVADDAHPALSPIEGENMDLRWPIHAVPGSRGFRLLQGLPHPSHYDYFIWKGVEPDMHPYGACYHDLQERLSTGVIEFLRSEGIHWVLLGGLATDFCVKATALQLRRAGFAVILNLAACRGISDAGVEQAQRQLLAEGVQLISSSDELQPIAGGAQAP